MGPKAIKIDRNVIKIDEKMTSGNGTRAVGWIDESRQKWKQSYYLNSTDELLMTSVRETMYNIVPYHFTRISLIPVAGQEYSNIST